MFTIENLFNIFALLYVLRSAQLLIVIARQWSSLRANPLTAAKKHLAEQASFFIAVPVAVFFHELAHALAVWAFGGQVLGFVYRFFWGEVQHQGLYTPAERWFIALAGTLGSLLFGAAIWWLLRRNPSAALRYFGLRAFRFQIYFSLLYYPLFSAILPIGDWRVIYDFAATPWLSGVTLAVHLVFLLFYWRFDRQGWFEEPSHETAVAQAEFDALEQALALQPQNVDLQLQYIDILRRGGAQNKAQTILTRFLRDNPDSAIAYLELAALEAGKQHMVSKQAVAHAEKALQLGLNEPRRAAMAYQMIAGYQLEVGQGTTAVQNYTSAIAALRGAAPVPADGRTLANLYRLRSLAYRRQQQYEMAYQDLQQALSLAQQLGDERLLNMFTEDLSILENHAGHPLGAGPPAKLWENGR
ncbi:MAG: M50 family metallopeptidase [Anaerolineales bacterium]|nr:M50 family metallopeptidase [Anaerolineales bacterium]